MGGVTKLINPTNIGRGLLGAATGGTSELFQKRPGGIIDNPTGLGVLDGLGFSSGQSNPYVSGPFSLDPYQLASDKKSINDLGQSQYDATNQFITQDQGNRTAARQSLADALTKQSQASFQQSLPGTEEMLNSQHLLNGSGLGQELARQQGNIATNIANQVGVQGAQDIDTASGQRAAALQGLQGSQTGALQRGLSMEDQINNANISKTIGQVFAPQAPTGKQNFATVAQGAGALAPFAKLAAGK